MNGKKMRTMLALLAVGLCVTIATVLAAHKGPGGSEGHGPHRDGMGGPGPFAALDLTDAQKEQIKALHDQFEQSHAAAFEQMKTLHEQIRSQMESGDKEGAKATRESIKTLQESLRPDHEALRAQVESILTDEQKAKLAEMHPKGSCDGKGKGEGRCHKGDKAQGETQTQKSTPGLD